MAKDSFSVRRRVQSFADAGRGVRLFFRTTHNAWIQAVLLGVAVVAGIYFDIARIDWMFLILAAGIVFASEAFNSALEIDIDLTSPEYHPYARDTKDVAAGAVLISSITSALIGACIFLPHIWSLISL